MAKNLLIVESPAKAKTIEKFLGKDYKVESSYGHIRDLDTKGLSVDVENNFKPKYVISPDKKEIVNKLKKLAQEAETVWLASDEDREGEAISWHLAETLKLDPMKTNRIVFHEITKTAIENSIKNPRKIDLNLVNAQQARRILDRLVGFEMSPVLWKKIKSGLSAGRVQSVAVRLIVEREREIHQFQSTSYFRVVAIFQSADGKTFKAELNQRFDTEDQALDFLKKVTGFPFEIVNVEKKSATRSPAPPFTTSTLQQEASRKLGFSVSQTMTLAQKLYEDGFITYMRTDSVNLSEEALAAIQSQIKAEFGEEYSKLRRYTTKSKGAQEAHEAIRPTYFDKKVAGSDAQQKKLYELIWKRAVASQMADAQIDRTIISLNAPGDGLLFQAKGEVIRFDGFLKLYIEGTDEEETDEDSALLPNVQIGDAVKALEIQATQRFTKHPPRYTEASLVKKLEELGIGRPSTYAPTIATIIKRGYVHKPVLEGKIREYKILTWEDGSIKEKTETEVTGAEKNKLLPTDIGFLVTDFLVENFNEILDYQFTAQVEEEFDEIARGQKDWVEMIRNFYNHFHPTVEEASEKKEKVTGERVLGTDPKTGKIVYAKIGRYGPMIQIGENTDSEKPQFASLLKNQSIETITLDEALKLFELPRKVGEYKGKEIVAAVGKYGPYIRYGDSFISLNPNLGDSPLTVTLERAIELIEEKRKSADSGIIQKFDGVTPEIQVLKGRYGPYIKQGKNNYKIPKSTNPQELTLEQCLQIIEAQKAKQ
ncbi:DNA topoisomerase 1 [Thermaurantimonas aggregans]|uniref:DNA topoisomerase 1 n=1 Tax=Thermaurantimonas aggregans TaxID=2173829 RepID=A0A401XIA2_9FLAO|nr:type I DNA topoisomerase [Thermaurantimonas aggregans]MCX8149038.1 type I DNA topoisomerase [Thermaurantimonas aggregans]GCD76728.1 DNA topoisomerase 1 [Thermaurantimonas aggregans]